MKKITLPGENIILRPLALSDANSSYLKWLKDKEVMRFMETRAAGYTLKDLRKYVKKMTTSGNSAIFAIIAKDAGIHIGNIKLGGINFFHRYANLGIMIGDKKYWSKGYAVEACRSLLRYAFRELNLNKITLGVYAAHLAAIRAYQKAGFKIEGRFKKMLNLEGKYVDKIVMGISCDEFKR